MSSSRLTPSRPSFLKPEDRVGYRHGQERTTQETMDYLDFIARVTSHIPDKGQVMIRYFYNTERLYEAPAYRNATGNVFGAGGGIQGPSGAKFDMDRVENVDCRASGEAVFSALLLKMVFCAKNAKDFTNGKIPKHHYKAS